MADYLVGLDLGQQADYTALAALRRTFVVGEDGFPARDRRGGLAYRYTCNHLERFPLGTPYPAIVARVAELMGRPELAPSPRLAVDATGVGRAVVDLFREAHMGEAVRFSAITITAGTEVSCTGRGEWNVCKIDLIGAAQAALASGRLKVARELKHADTLKRELLDYRVKVTPSAHETFAAREGQHDDLVLALALPLWMGEQRPFAMSSAAGATPAEQSALTRERRAEEEAEAAALDRERREWEARIRREMLLSDNPDLWTAI